MGVLYDKVRKPDVIWNAWHVVQENGRVSKSGRTRAEIADFASQAPKEIRRIVRQLQRRRFRFEPAMGVAIPKKSGGKRPVVLAPVPNRIVQRAILDVVQAIPEIQRRISQGKNYGGVEGLGVPKAVRDAFVAARRKEYFIRTDIKSFFVNVPRPKALEKILKHTNDPVFDDLLVRATTTELDNLASLGRDAEAFPLEDVGVAQGSALSPLLCNLLLDDIDEMMNGRGIEFIRYIDDFILFAPDRAKAKRALASARRELAAFNLDCYDPDEHPDKAEEGSTDTPFHFLGCELTPDGVRPASKSRNRLLQKIDDIARHAISASCDPLRAVRERHTYLDATNAISNTVRGWGNTYAFCTDDRLMQDVDREVSKRLAHFRRCFAIRLEGRSDLEKRRLTGIFALADCNRDDDLRSVILSAAAERRQRVQQTPKHTSRAAVSMRH